LTNNQSARTKYIYVKFYHISYRKRFTDGSEFLDDPRSFLFPNESLLTPLWQVITSPTSAPVMDG